MVSISELTILELAWFCVLAIFACYILHHIFDDLRISKKQAKYDKEIYRMRTELYRHLGDIVVYHMPTDAVFVYYDIMVREKELKATKDKIKTVKQKPIPKLPEL